MNYIKKILDLYLSKKNNINNIKLIFNFFIILILSVTIIVMIEQYAYFSSEIKIKISNLIKLSIYCTFIFLIFRTIIHKYHFWDNSNYQELALELIDKLPTKDRIVNALQIYSQINTKNTYSDLSIKAINDLENQLKKIKIQKIKIKFPFKNLCLLIISFCLFTGFIVFSEKYYDAFNRTLSKNISFNKPLPFEIEFNNLKNQYSIFKNDDLECIIKGNGILPPEIDLYWSSNNTIYTKKINQINQNYKYTFKNIKSDMKVWAQYSKKSILNYNSYQVQTDTLEILLKERPELKKINIIIESPEYTKIDQIKHAPSLSKIKLLQGSTIIIEGIANKKLNSAQLKFKNDSIINMSITDNIINTKFEVLENTSFEIICFDFENNQNIKLEYFLELIDDLKPYVTITYPLDNFKIDARIGMLEQQIQDLKKI